MKKEFGLTQAFRTITSLNIKGNDSENVTNQLYFFPLVGLVISVIAVIPCQILRYFLPPNIIVSLISGSVFTLNMALLTRGFHLDGLGDMADGFGGSFDKEKILSIMSDSRSGSFSVITICLTLIIKTLASSLLIQMFSCQFLILSVFVSRSLVAFECGLCTYAKPEGLSHNLVNNAGFKQILSSVLQIVVVSTYAIFLTDFVSVISVVIAEFISLFTVERLSYKKIGGITGDVLGATAEITETVGILIGSLVLYIEVCYVI